MRLLADENFNNDMLRGLRLRYPEIDIIQAQDVEIYQASDPVVLNWAAQENRVLLTHDVKTIPDFAYARVASNLPMPGVIEVNDRMSIGDAIEKILVLILAGEPSDFENRVIFISSR